MQLEEETTGVVPIVDAFVAWLVALLGDASRKKLTMLVLGSEQERALHQAATAAIQFTAKELDRSGGQQAGQLAMVVNEVSGQPTPDAPLAGQATLLEALQAGIAERLAVLDDADLTGTGQSSAEVLGVPGSVLAETLASHLLREIMLRGSRGGPLAPLASQLNFDVSHLQGQRLEGMLAHLADQVRTLAQAGSAAVASKPVRLLPRPAWLAGREGLLADLDARLTEASVEGPQAVALCGLGGAGKTSVALEYAHRHLARLGLVWQFPAEEATALVAGFAELAAQLGAQDVADPRDPILLVHGVLAARAGDWLLIFDNAPGPAALQHVLPPGGRGRVIITSQDPHWPGRQALDVPTLGRDVAAAFLQDRTGSEDQDAAGELADELGGLPLALEQAGAYMQVTGDSLASYLALFRQRRAEMLRRGKPTGYSETVATTWVLALDQLERSAPEAVGLLRLLAHYAPEAIPWRLLLQPRPGLVGQLSQEVAAVLVPLLEDELAARDAIAALRRYSLVSRRRRGGLCAPLGAGGHH
jgi:hypothetical protein